MTQSVTLEDIYALFQRSQDLAEQRNADWERRFAESKAEAERRAAESKAEAERRAAESKAEAERRAAESKAEAERRAAEFQAEAERRAAEAKAEDERRAAAAKAEADRRAAEWEQSFAAAKAEDERRAKAWEKEMAEFRAETERRAKAWEKEIAEFRAETERLATEAKAETDRRAAEAKAETDRRAAEAKTEAERRAAESKAEADRRAVEWEQKWEQEKAAAAVRLAKLEEINTRTSQAIDALTSRWGRFVENLVAPAVLRLFQERGIPVNRSFQRAKGSEGGRHLEIDILALNHDVAIAVEVKSRLTQRNLRQFIKNLESFKAIFPEYADRTLYGAVAAIEVDKDIDLYTYKQGLFLIEQSGDSVKISNAEDFTPRAW